MEKEKNKNEVKQPIKVEEKVFTKEQLVNSNTFKDDRDVLNAKLEDNKKYTKKQVQEIIENFKKGKVK